LNWLKIAVLFLIIWSSFSASLAALYYYNNQNLEKDVEYLRSNVAISVKNVTVFIIVNFNNGTVLAEVVHFNLGNSFSAFNATQLAFGKAIDYKYYPEYKDMVISRFFDLSNDMSSSHFWTLYINNVSSSSGALKTILSPDDVVEWRYQKI
jgi:hypothetical protein